MKYNNSMLPSHMRDKRGRLIEIRPFANSDYTALKEMYDNFEPKGLEAGLPPHNEKIRHQWIDQILRCFFNVVAVHRHRIIGHAALDIGEIKECPEYFIFIEKGSRYLNIGTKMSEVMKGVARGVGCKRIWLTVRTGNTIAIKVFRKVGFEFTGGIDIQREMYLLLRKP